MIAFIDILTIIISTFFLLHILKKVSNNARSLIYLIFFVLYVLPLYLDYSIGFSDLSYGGKSYYGFIVSRGDVLTVLVYDFLLIISQGVLACYNIKRKTSESLYVGTLYNKKVLITLIAGMVFPAFCVVSLLGHIGMLYTFQWRELGLFPTGGVYSVIEQFCYVGVCCSLLLLFVRRRLMLLKLTSLVFLYINICIQGKRSIMFFAILITVVMLYLVMVDRISLKKPIKLYLASLTIIAACCIAFMIVSSSLVKMERGYDITDTNKIMSTLRVDFFRDDRVRMAIYSAIHPDDISILQYPGQTILSNILSLKPLNHFAEFLGLDIYSYQVHFTYALTDSKQQTILDPDSFGWMTVTFMAEIISNFGVILSFLIIPFILLSFSKLLDLFGYPLNCLTCFYFLLVCLFDFTYSIYFFEILAIVIIYRNYKLHKNKRIICYENGTLKPRISKEAPSSDNRSVYVKHL